MSSFVLLYHSCPQGVPRPSHWDLMIEAGEVLQTWVLAILPNDWQFAHAATTRIDSTCSAIAAGNTIAAERLADHRREYLEFEGPLSGNRGHAYRIDRGAYAAESWTAERLRLCLAGDVLRVRITLQQNSARAESWTLTSEPDHRLAGSFDDAD